MGGDSPDVEDEKYATLTLMDMGAQFYQCKYIVGSDIAIPKITNLHQGYVFSGWSIDGTSIIAPGDMIRIESDVTMNAVWVDVKSYTLAYVVGGITVLQEEYTSGTIVTISDCTIARDGYEFKGWTAGSGLIYPGDKITINGDITLTASWETSTEEPVVPEDPVEHVILRLFLSPSNPCFSETYVKGQEVEIPIITEAYDNPCTFLGWSNEQLGIYLKQPGDKIQMYTNLALIARYQDETVDLPEDAPAAPDDEDDAPTVDDDIDYPL